MSIRHRSTYAYRSRVARADYTVPVIMLVVVAYTVIAAAVYLSLQDTTPAPRRTAAQHVVLGPASELQQAFHGFATHLLDELEHNLSIRNRSTVRFGDTGFRVVRMDSPRQEVVGELRAQMTWVVQDEVPTGATGSTRYDLNLACSFEYRLGRWVPQKAYAAGSAATSYAFGNGPIRHDQPRYVNYDMLAYEPFRRAYRSVG